MISKETLEMKNPYADAGNGYFTVYDPKTKTNIDNIHSCRETFSSFLNSLSAERREFIGFSLVGVNIETMEKFMSILEGEKLKLKEKSVLYRTNLKNYVIIKPSSFWMQNVTRRDIFTIFLRSAPKMQDGDGKKILPAVLRYNLGAAVVMAIVHFMRGNVNPTYGNSYSGFVNKFQNMKPAELEKALVH